MAHIWLTKEDQDRNSRKTQANYTREEFHDYNPRTTEVAGLAVLTILAIFVALLVTLIVTPVPY